MPLPSPPRSSPTKDRQRNASAASLFISSSFRRRLSPCLPPSFSSPHPCSLAPSLSVSPSLSRSLRGYRECGSPALILRLLSLIPRWSCWRDTVPRGRGFRNARADKQRYVPKTSPPNRDYAPTYSYSHPQPSFPMQLLDAIVIACYGCYQYDNIVYIYNYAFYLYYGVFRMSISIVYLGWHN